jgi:hypothetical protein
MPEREAQPSRPPLPSKPGVAKMPAYFQLYGHAAPDLLNFQLPIPRLGGTWSSVPGLVRANVRDDPQSYHFEIRDSDGVTPRMGNLDRRYLFARQAPRPRRLLRRRQRRNY